MTTEVQAAATALATLRDGWAIEHPNGTAKDVRSWSYRPVYLVTPSGRRIRFNEVGDTSEVDFILAAIKCQ